ncbi:hypothetical protein KA050_03645 [Candidatus Gracilibacteria bacterium]|nr:hypothetical protein [Candidatus Gracilibacteria bacterium]
MSLPELPSSDETIPPLPSKTRIIQAQPNTVVWKLPKGKFGNGAELGLLLMGYIRQKGNRGSSVQVLVESNDPTPTVKGPIKQLRERVKELKPGIIEVLDGDVENEMARVRTFVSFHLRAPKEVK